LLDNFQLHYKLLNENSDKLKKINFLNNSLVKEENTLSEYIKYINKFYSKISDEYKTLATEIRIKVDSQKKFIEDLRKISKYLFSNLKTIEKDYNEHLIKLKYVRLFLKNIN